MSGENQKQALSRVAHEEELSGRTVLCVALVITEYARKTGLPIERIALTVASGAQVKGLGKQAVQKILNRYGILGVLAQEGGRTSPSSVGIVHQYVRLLNRLHADGALDLDAAENFWIDRIRQLPASSPRRVTHKRTWTLRTSILAILNAGGKRRSAPGGASCIDRVLYHLVGAKLDRLLGPGRCCHASYGAIDTEAAGWGEYEVSDAVIHVAAMVSERLIERCVDSLARGRESLIVTLAAQTAIAAGLAVNKGTGDRIEIFAAEQFLAANLYEIGKFTRDGRATATTNVIARYNELVAEYETDPSLKIDMVGTR